jgi:hypothetical protein
VTHRGRVGPREIPIEVPSRPRALFVGVRGPAAPQFVGVAWVLRQKPNFTARSAHRAHGYRRVIERSASEWLVISPNQGNFTIGGVRIPPTSRSALRHRKSMRRSGVAMSESVGVSMGHGRGRAANLSAPDGTLTAIFGFLSARGWDLYRDSPGALDASQLQLDTFTTELEC